APRPRPVATPRRDGPCVRRRGPRQRVRAPAGGGRGRQRAGHGFRRCPLRRPRASPSAAARRARCHPLRRFADEVLLLGGIACQGRGARRTRWRRPSPGGNLAPGAAARPAHRRGTPGRSPRARARRPRQGPRPARPRPRPGRAARRPAAPAGRVPGCARDRAPGARGRGRRARRAPACARRADRPVRQLRGRRRGRTARRALAQIRRRTHRGDRARRTGGGVVKPLALTMQAFGPFAGREHLDFAALGDDPLFLIHGPTGAGKSSILDAICVALYGDTAGGERRAAQMRSHHAPDDRPTEVVFEFALGAERYRASRSPEQSRPSRRARDGFVTEPARAELPRWRDRRWQALAARPADVDREVRRLLGLDLDQFRQVVLLPQGRFREALNADSARREQILETLFATGPHRRLQEDLARQAGSLREQHAQARGVTTTLLAQRGLEDLAQLATAIQETGAELARLAAEHERLSGREARALAALDAARALAARFEEHRAATLALDTLLADAGRAQALRERLEAGRRAASAGASYQRLVDGRSRVAATTADAQRCEAGLAAARRVHEERHAAWQRLLSEAPEAEARREERRRLAVIAQE